MVAEIDGDVQIGAALLERQIGLRGGHGRHQRLGRDHQLQPERGIADGVVDADGEAVAVRIAVHRHSQVDFAGEVFVTEIERERIGAGAVGRGRDDRGHAMIAVVGDFAGRDSTREAQSEDQTGHDAEKTFESHFFLHHEHPSIEERTHHGLARWVESPKRLLPLDMMRYLKFCVKDLN